jgi:NAD(P)-dependent dehydrogenase (short-subunit alcohol dehydrogenase family)
MTPRASEPKKVAIITGASRGIGAGLVEAYRRAGYAVVGTSRSIVAGRYLPAPAQRGERARALRLSPHSNARRDIDRLR